jgi:quinol monooxygenase YgiN
MSQQPAKIPAVLTARSGKSNKLVAACRMARLCGAEPGNLRRDIWLDPSHDGRYVLDELYRDAAAVDAHRNSPHYRACLTKIPDLTDRSAFVLQAVKVRLFASTQDWIRADFCLWIRADIYSPL